MGNYLILRKLELFITSTEGGQLVGLAVLLKLCITEPSRLNKVLALHSNSNILGLFNCQKTPIKDIKNCNIQPGRPRRAIRASVGSHEL